ncbi:pathogenicity island protein [Staphylococcus aureus]|uniref:pathogenicity island protein n=1 Tax=Staphylococcus aureus TaxID=1280 RepID=UPI000F5001B7|nr:pathogenicity island protein [Staphylococcus aureus]
MNFNDSQARKFIKVFNEFQNRSTSNTLGVEALYQIATLPEPERTKEHITSNGETKTPDEMTVRELRELKKQLKQRDEENARLQSQMKKVQLSEEIERNQYKYGLNNYIFTIKF